MPVVLIIEDDPDIGESLKDLLELADYDVIVTDREEKIAAILEKSLPDIILLDLLLSGKDGATICRDLKANTRTHMIPVVMMSAHPNAKKEAAAAGANDFIPKPFDGGELLDVLKRNIKQK